jgi:hypothetical protein
MPLPITDLDSTDFTPGEQVTYTNGYSDAPKCICGNYPDDGGFHAADAAGTYVNPAQDWTHTVCQDCGRVFTDIPANVNADDHIVTDCDEIPVTIPGAGLVIGRLDNIQPSRTRAQLPARASDPAGHPC